MTHTDRRSPGPRLIVAPLVFSHPVADLPASGAMAEGAAAHRARHIRFSARPTVSTSASR
ncbi:MAG TPA: hypothetical protein VJT49_26310 [Amycolatopsis sp.]|uniref:hypothetical protein n=1 Tax=Amycolatopsis sp. TaxID=37632 RepID=UPI002B4A3288|nr:hypothetical protein [Amycolatopsis sp.]HKS48562.1 hypothetical protein [Amycolatopsis sp.]